jgi:hypothetical protein
VFNPLEIVNNAMGVYGKIHDSVDNWNSSQPVANRISNIAEEAVDILDEVPGMTQADARDFKRATPRFTLSDGSVLKMWKNPVGVEHVFIADTDGKMIFGGYVGWIHSDGLNYAVAQIKRQFT